MFVFEVSDNIFAYPFILSEVPRNFCNGGDKLYDISSVYGNSGPLIKRQDKEFFKLAWSKFDKWA